MFEKKFQYSFSQADMSNIKGSLGEKLIQSYIKKELVPALTKQGWDDVIFSPTHGLLQNWEAWLIMTSPKEKGKPDSSYLTDITLPKNFLNTLKN